MQNYNKKSLDPLRSLRSNATAYFDRLFATHRQNMACGVGCSKCCEVEALSVHESEAMLIWEWFAELSAEKRLELQKTWEAQKEHNAQACPFLVKKRCSVYEARPIICRTQGAPLRFKIDEGEVGVDACPLNFTAPDLFPTEGEWLDLDRLNTLLTIAEQSYQKETQQRPLKDLLNAENRVSLKSLQQFLLKKA